jgi:hypothetical protein
MKATGIVRKIDELGRVVIPKEVRRTQVELSSDRIKRMLPNRIHLPGSRRPYRMQRMLKTGNPLKLPFHMLNKLKRVIV